jgi:hypothetical protein
MTDDRTHYRVPKETVGAVVRTADQLIVGQLHMSPHKRLKDELNMLSDRYLAITGARVYDAPGTTLLYEARFMLVATKHIVSVTPLEGVGSGTEAVWFKPESH